MNDQYLEKPLPSSPDAERCILGGILLNPELIHEVSPHLLPEHFYSPLHRKIYQAMIGLAYTENKPIDPILIGEELKKVGSLDSIGGIATITNMTFGLPHFDRVDDYVQTVKGKAALRDRIRSCNQIIADCIEEGDSTDTILRRTEMLFNDNVERSGRSLISDVANIDRAVDAFSIKTERWKKGTTTSLPSPMPLLNRRLNERGFAYGELSLIAARPSDGKTTFGVQCANHIAQHYAPALIITLEMAKEDIIQKIIAGEAQVPNYRINEGLFQSQRFEDLAAVGRIEEAKKRIRNRPLFIDEESTTLSNIISTATDYIIQKGVRFVMVDYGQIITNDISRGNQTRDRELGQIAEELKKLAKRETKTKSKVHVQLCVQLKRLKASPTIDDLRESGSFEQVADLILAPFGEVPTEEVVLRDMKLLCLKQRKGRRGWQLPITLHGDWQRFYDSQNMEDQAAEVNRSLLSGPGSEF